MQGRALTKLARDYQPPYLAGAHSAQRRHPIQEQEQPHMVQREMSTSCPQVR